MKRIALTLALTLISGTAAADCRIHHDGAGGGTVRCDDGRTGSLYSDESGYTGGRIGDERIRLYRNPDGSTTGRIGDEPVRIYRNPDGSAHGRVGDQPIRIYQSQPGFSSGFEAGSDAARDWR